MWHAVALLLLAINAESGKIFVFSPRFAQSHVRFMGRIADILAEEGHAVTVLQPVINYLIPNDTLVSKAKVIVVDQDKKAGEGYHFNYKQFRNPWVQEPQLPALVTTAIHFAEQCNYTLSQKELIEQLKAEEFDVGITEGYDHCGIALLEVLKCKSRIVTTSTVGMESVNAYIGVPNIYSYCPVSIAKASDEADYKTRFFSLITTLATRYYYYRFRTELEYVTQAHFGPDFPRISELMGNMDLVFTNSHPYLDFPHPTLEKIIDIGGIALNTPKPLTKSWIKILNLRKHTAFVSFGSIAYSSMLPLSWKLSLLKAMQQFSDTTFVLKYEDLNDEFAQGVSKNVILTDWAPQIDLLFSGQIDLFVTHGGLASVYESAFSGTPTLFVPLFADQFRNAKMVEKKGFGKILSKHSLNNTELISSLFGEMLNNDQFKLNAKKTQRILNSRPMSPKELLISYVNLAIAEGRLDFLDPAGRKMSFLAYHNLDIIIPVFVLLMLLFVIVGFNVLFVVRLCWRCAARKSKTE